MSIWVAVFEQTVGRVSRLGEEWDCIGFVEDTVDIWLLDIKDRKGASGELLESQPPNQLIIDSFEALLCRSWRFSTDVVAGELTLNSPSSAFLLVAGPEPFVTSLNGASTS